MLKEKRRDKDGGQNSFQFTGNINQRFYLFLLRKYFMFKKAQKTQTMTK